MRYQNDLAILSAETYAFGRRHGSPKAVMADNGPQTTFPTPADGPRKRTKLKQPAKNAENAEKTEQKGDENKKKKKGRGRPRLAIRDESAAERRRAQIRLAQRAYRSRKELAIQSLEQRVQRLKNTNEQMSNAFMKLHDFAVNQGLLHLVPDFGRELRQTTEKFVTLAQRSADDNANEDDQEQGDTPDQDSADGREDGDESPGAELRRSEPQRSEAPEIPNRIPGLRGGEERQNEEILYGGFMVSHEIVSLSNDLISNVSTTLDTPAAVDGSPGYEVVTFPTPENASFPFSMSADLTVPDFSNPTPYTPLAPPDSLAAHETTFGRRLQRQGFERALALIMTPNASPARVSRVFGFSALVETPATIERRLRAVLARNYQESLSYWQFPFPHLGGAGTHFDQDAIAPSLRPQQRIGNQGTADVFKTRVSNGMSMGPFDARTHAAADWALDQNFQITGVPGMRGDFFDTDDVELYLYQSGVTIPPGADFVTAEIDPAQFGYPNSGAPDLDRGSPAVVPSMMGLCSASALTPGTMQGSWPSLSSPSSGETRMTELQAPSPDRPASVAWDPNALFSGAFPNVSGDQLTMAAPSAVASFSVDRNAASGSHLMAAGESSTVGYNARHVADAGVSRRTVISVDVKRFINELLLRCSCLGRSLGVRKADINEAFRIAARPIRE